MMNGIVDAHQHFWDPNRFEYVWMSPKVQPLVRAFLPEDLKPIVEAAGVQYTVVVQAISSLDEARWLLQLASKNEFIAGVVTWCDLQSADLGVVLDELQKHPKFKGVRHQIEDESDDSWMLRDKVVAGFRELERRAIPYDMLVRPRHLRLLTEVRDLCPGLKIVVDHIAKPRIADRLFEPWASDLSAAAKLPNVWCKLSGMNTEANWKTWTHEDLKPYVRHVVDSFGYDRVMFGSDWPVCVLAGTYEQTINVLKEALGPLSAEASIKLWRENAIAFYSLNPAVHSTNAK